ncbi:MAG TPA: G/U mismatch-specific DNA glycosylase [Nitrospira sp.]|nr:G/U mismatch-specific DNA glycosylase [Nitrospira sp.]
MVAYEPDTLAAGLRAVFCGINPATSAENSGYSFSAPSNRFWNVLYLSGFTDVRLRPQDEHRLLEYGYGITAVIRRSTRQASEIPSREFREAKLNFEERMARVAPRAIAFLGKRAFAAMMNVTHVNWGCQPTTIRGIQTWILPNPSGRNRLFTLEDLVRAYAEFRLTLKE